MKKGLSICLVSGGLDSCVTAALADKEDNLAFLHAGYGQLTEEREDKAFNDIADFFDIPTDLRLVVRLDFLKEIGGSALIDEKIEMAEAPCCFATGKPERGEGVPATYVPFRNANLLSVAVSWAEVIGAEKIYIGAMEEDSSGYPDCREIFFNSFQLVVKTGTKVEGGIEIVTPIIHLSKAEVIKLGLGVGAPLHLSWSCYRSNGHQACGVCESCALRLRGFKEAGHSDPISYATSVLSKTN